MGLKYYNLVHPNHVGSFIFFSCFVFTRLFCGGRSIKLHNWSDLCASNTRPLLYLECTYLFPYSNWSTDQ